MIHAIQRKIEIVHAMLTQQKLLQDEALKKHKLLLSEKERLANEVSLLTNKIDQQRTFYKNAQKESTLLDVTWLKQVYDYVHTLEKALRQTRPAFEKAELNCSNQLGIVQELWQKEQQILQKIESLQQQLMQLKRIQQTNMTDELVLQRYGRHL